MFDKKAYQAKYRKENKEKIKKLQADYYAKNREKRIKNATDWAKQNKEQLMKTRRKYMSTPQGRLTSVKGSAKTRQIQFSLTDQQALNILEKPCYYCGNTEKYGIDRIDSSFGYTLKNSVSCCDDCNYMKRIMSQKDFIQQCKKIANYHNDISTT